MRIETFELERAQSIWENRVRYNLSESGVHPMLVREVLDEDLRDERLGYPQTNGTIPLRERISALYPGTGPDSILVTSGTAEANYLSTWSLVEPGDEVLVMVPNYMQVWGIARALGADVKRLPLEPAGDRWQLDLDSLESAVTPRTRLIAICTPNNPTGAVLTESELDAIAAAAGRVGAWVISDEVYRGAEVEGEISPSFHGRYERGLVHCGLSKACGLPGLRVGWICGPDEKIASLWGYKDYTTIGPSSLSDRIAQAALEPSRRRAILERTRTIIRRQLPTMLEWVAQHNDILELIPPKAGAIAYLKYGLPVDSTRLYERLRDEKEVLIVPGDFFAMDRYLRVGFGCEPEILEIGLARIAELLATVKAESGEAARA